LAGTFDGFVDLGDFRMGQFFPAGTYRGAITQAAEEDFDFAQFISLGIIGLTTVACSLSVRELRWIRNGLHQAAEKARLRNRAKRREVIHAKLEARKDARTAQSSFDDL